MFDYLKKIPLFADLPDEDLDRLCSIVEDVQIAAGDILFTEGEMGDKAYVILSGEIDILKESGGRSVLLASRRAGEVIGEMSLLDHNPRFATGVAKTDSNVLSISHENLDNLLDSSPSAARAMLSTITNRLRSTQIVLRQSEKMAQLGTFSAGIAHELNNPASAALRGTEHLQTSIQVFQQAYQKFHAQGFTDHQWKRVAELFEYVQRRVSQPVDLDNLSRGDCEAEIEDWLDDYGVENSWEISPDLVSLGYQPLDLDDLKEDFPGESLFLVLRWLVTVFNIYSLLEEVQEGTTRIGDIVNSLKSYVYLDQAPIQAIDLHEGIDNTLVILRSKLGKGITVNKNYADQLPIVQAYGGELNQVWTNIIDNAVDAMDGQGVITLSTSLNGDWVNVDIEDTGSGIPEGDQDKLFTPFFTTKAVGNGTGLGLNICYNIIQKH